MLLNYKGRVSYLTHKFNSKKIAQSCVWFFQTIAEHFLTPSLFRKEKKGHLTIIFRQNQLIALREIKILLF
jgi:hypothetical protein